MLGLPAVSLGLLLPRLPVLVRRAGVVRLVANDFFEQEQWKALSLELDTVPVFALVTDKGMPLQTDGKTIFFADASDADAQLAKARAAMPDSLLEVQPLGLAKAWMAQVEGEALLAPSKAELRAAGANVKGEEAVFGAVPVFACMDLTTNRLDGTPCVPLFLSMADAQRAVKEAKAEIMMTPGALVPDEIGAMEIDIFSLDKAIEQSVTAKPGGTVFRFVGSTASLHKMGEKMEAASRATSSGGGPTPS